METTRQELPEGFQTAEFLLEHGFLDQIVERTRLKKHIASFLAAFSGRKRRELDHSAGHA
jgi:acetyl-CoA carboxylase carboxyl transferase subunit beta